MFDDNCFGGKLDKYFEKMSIYDRAIAQKTFKL